MNNEFEELKESFAKLGQSVVECANAFKNLFSSLPKETKEMLRFYNFPNSRIKHLAYYSKKKRVRKKNYNRLLKGGEW